MDGKISLVTGGNSDIGLATAKQFVNEGAYVFITEHREAELAVAIRKIGRNVTGVRGGLGVSRRGTICQVRWEERLEITSSCSAATTTSFGLSAIKFGRAVRTPAMQVGLSNRALILRAVFSSKIVFSALKNVLFETVWPVSLRIPAVRLAA